jgi:hypothetical protein
MATTTRKRRIPRLKTIGGDLTAQVKDYLLNRSMRERSEYQEGYLKRLLMAALEEGGEQVEKHKQVIPLDEVLPYTQYKNGKPVQKSISGIERRERVANRLDEDKALVLLKRKKLLESCTTTIVVVDEDAILAANYEGTITDKELASLYTESSTFAFYLTEEPT